jgi:hypothetical protein
MATDVARLSFDPARFYTGVVSQQGRVALEAEENEQRVINAEERRKELLDIVGSAGTPDDGYAVITTTGSSDITISPGIMYVGGLRVELDQPLPFSNQPDWLDRANIRVVDEGFQHVVLTLHETDVTAVEDPALYEVSLGGPDGAARTRILQHIERLPTDANDCTGALIEDVKRWETLGLTFDDETMQLLSNTRLLVTWVQDPEPPNPCEPSSTGGYIGAENQCIRVQITAVDAKRGTFDLVWGYDDASFLYRVTPDASTNPILTLDRSPVDDFHRPRAGQAVQVLRSAAELQSTDGVVEGYVAALGGEVGVLAAPYDPDTKTVQFPGPLPGEYTDTTETPQLYLRVWEEQLTGLSLGTPIDLTGTGMQVTITVDGGGPVHIDDFWSIGVRPATPTTVYPDRYLRAPQPPDGPREWVCPLAVIAWEKEQLVVVEDCRNHFDPLIHRKDCGCCTLDVGPGDAKAGKLQAKIDAITTARALGDHGSRVTVCFAPGRYELPEPLVLRKVHSNLHLQGCSEGAVILAAPGEEKAFAEGLFILADVDNVTISGMEFVMPQVPAVLGKVGGTSGSVFSRDVVRAMNVLIANRYVSVAIRPINCAMLEIRDCLFRFSLGEHAGSAEIEQTMPRNVFGVAILAAGGAWGLRLERNRFLHHPVTPINDEERFGRVHLLAGYLLAQTAVSRVADTKTRAIGSGRLPALLDNAEIVDNRFDGISAAVLVEAELGNVNVSNNVVEDCYSGILLIGATAAAYTNLVDKFEVSGAAQEAMRLARTAMAAGLLDPVLVELLTFASTFPLPRFGNFVPHGVVHFDDAQLTQLRADALGAQNESMTRFVQDIAAEHPVGAERPAAPAKRTRVAKFDFNAPSAREPDAQLDKNLHAVRNGLDELARIGPAVEHRPGAFTIEANQIDCQVPNDGTTGPALFVYANLYVDSAAGTIANNRLVSRHPTVTAAVTGVAAATITGNIIGAPRRGDNIYALAVGGVPGLAVTGNFAGGSVLLPTNRPFPAPLDTWDPLNTFV